MGDPPEDTYNGITKLQFQCKGKLVHGFERVAEVVIAGWLLFNTLSMALVAVGVARQYARVSLERRTEQAREVVFDQALTLTE